MRAEDLQCEHCGNDDVDRFGVFYEMQAHYDLVIENGEVRAVAGERNIDGVDGGWAHVYCTYCGELVLDLNNKTLPWSRG
jgi:hypothetical protein